VASVDASWVRQSSLQAASPVSGVAGSCWRLLLGMALADGVAWTLRERELADEWGNQMPGLGGRASSGHASAPSSGTRLASARRSPTAGLALLAPPSHRDPDYRIAGPASYFFFFFLEVQLDAPPEEIKRRTYRRQLSRTIRTS